MQKNFTRLYLLITSPAPFVIEDRGFKTRLLVFPPPPPQKISTMQNHMYCCIMPFHYKDKIQ